MLTIHYGQTKIKNTNSPTSVIEKDYLKGLHKPTDEEKEELSLTLTPSLNIYNTEGQKISFNDFLPLLQSGEYTLEPYLNDNNELKAAVLRTTTEEEKIKMKEVFSKTEEANELVGKNAKPFNVTDINGNRFSIEELKGKIIVINFWFIECKPCVVEIPDLNKLVEDYKGKEIVFLGFAINKTSKLNSFLNKKEFKYNIIPESKDIISSYGINSFPTHIIIDKNSKITFSTSGLSENTINDLRKEIEKLLKL